MAETASLVYGWQFDPSYYEVVRDTLATNVSGTDSLSERLAPIATPTPVSAVPYELDKKSPPPPLVEGALYGAYIPKTLYSDVTSEGTFTGEVPPLSAPPPQSMAWPELANVFIPGLNGDKGNKTECWFFPLYWMGRISDRNNVAVLPLLGRHQTSTFRTHFEQQSWNRKDAGLPPFSPTNPLNLHWEILEAKEFNAKFRDTTNWNSFVRELSRECDDCLPELKARIDEARRKAETALEDFPRLSSPYVIPNVSWEKITIYMDGVLSTMKDYYVQDSRPIISEAAIELPSDFGSTATAAVVMERTHAYMENNDPSKLFTWWGMAHTEWLETYKKRAQTTIVNYIAAFTDAGSVEKDALRTFSMTGFPFKTQEGATIVRGEDLRAPNREIMTPKGREFFEKMIEPVVAAGGVGGLEIPDITVEEAQQIEEDAREAEKAARQAAGAQGDASKNVTTTKKAKEKAEVGLASAIDEENTAELTLSDLEGGSAYKELEKAKKTVETLTEMEMPVPEKLEKTVTDLKKKIGKEVEKASGSVTKATAKVVAATTKETKASADFSEAERIFAKVKVAHGKAEETLEDSIKQTAVIKALASHIYVPSYEGYASFIQDVRKGYSVATLTNTGQDAVGTAFRWFSGSPQAASGQTGRWSADSTWESEKNAATSALKDRQPIGGFKMPSRPRERVLAGPVPVDMMDGSQTTMQVGRPNKMKRGSYVVFEDLNAVMAQEFIPLFEAYRAAYPAEEVEEGYENLVFEITDEAKTNKEGNWITTIQPVAFFSPSYRPVAEFESALPNVPFGETEITVDSSDPFVMIPPARVGPLAPKYGTPSKKSFVYSSFGETLEFAEGLGWEDIYGDSDDEDYDADSIEGEALDYIKSKGYLIVDEDEPKKNPTRRKKNPRYPSLGAADAREAAEVLIQNWPPASMKWESLRRQQILAKQYGLHTPKYWTAMSTAVERLQIWPQSVVGGQTLAVRHLEGSPSMKATAIAHISDQYDKAVAKEASAPALTAAGSGAANAKYLDSLPPAKKAKILNHIADHYGVSVAEIEDEVTDPDAENLFEYTATDRRMSMEIYNDFKRQGLLKSLAKNPTPSTGKLFT